METNEDDGHCRGAHLGMCASIPCSQGVSQRTQTTRERASVKC